MQCTLTVIFTDESLFSHDFKGPKIFSVENPPFIPNPGETVRFHTAEFTNDAQTIENFTDFQDNDLFYCDLHSKTYGKEKMEVRILVYPEKEFRDECPELYAQVNGNSR
ncbi:hypothetical protein ABDD95_07640 [Mucilaginibacter sp. PAMB04274]|uniref:hypothetical protein n=1 Tax=Mucilaginibacter sp. PAMB04274 TaxID=3138568 RepID=UPI0031F6C30B